MAKIRISQVYFMVILNKLFDQLNGKELSYNNLVDVDAAIQLIREAPLNSPTRGGFGVL